MGIDFAKAFDSVSIKSIDRAMTGVGIDEQLRCCIINAYSGSTTTVNGGPNSIPDVKLNRGVKQGDPLSPIHGIRRTTGRSS